RFANDDLVGRTCQAVSAGFSAHACDETAAPKYPEQLCNISRRYALCPADLRNGDAPLHSAAGDVKQASNSVFFVCGQFHLCNLLSVSTGGDRNARKDACGPRAVETVVI